ncbi:hypothetical protein LTR53_016549 [Teratosphaeriaceae sp. CCFEE 6253]|nr:hypothetical protein LTR53_016549 [Teratosphaeriaceae sp. CCFEE 6253]
MPDVTPLQERDANAPTQARFVGNSWMLSPPRYLLLTVRRLVLRSDRVKRPMMGKVKNLTAQEAARSPTAQDISDIHLEGEADAETPIFDTCDDVRRKMKQALSDTTQADLARKLDALLPRSSVTLRQVAPFMKFKGPQAGAHCPVFYAAYVYFEKLRLAEQKKTSAKREKMEQIWGGRRDEEHLHWNSKGSPLGGFPREGAHNARLTCHVSERWRHDQYGDVHISS